MNQDIKTKVRTICVDGDSMEVTYRFDEQWQKWIGEYPFFKGEPRHTPSGRPWRNVSYTECPHHCGGEYNDCGTCSHFTKESPKDLIGVCFNEILRLREADTV